MMKEAEFKKIQEVQKGVAFLREMREKQEQIRIQEQHMLNERLEKDIIKKPKGSRNDNQVTSKTVVETSAKSKAQNRYGEE
jgi:hypothetical protein